MSDVDQGTTTNTRIVVDDNGEILIDGISFSKERMLSLYNKFLNIYNDGLKKLKKLGIDLDTVESVSSLGISKYKVQNDAFYNCFDKNTVYIKKYKKFSTGNPVLMEKTFKIITDMSSAMLLLLHFSSGGTYRLSEICHFHMDNNGTVMKLYQPDDGKAYLYIVSDYSKKVLIVNDEVTKYFIHFILALYPLRHDAVKDLPLDSSVNEPSRILNDVELSFDDDFQGVIESSGLITAKDCLNTFVFTVPRLKNNEYYASRMVTPILKELLKVDESQSYITISSLRQALFHYKNETGFKEANNAFKQFQKIMFSGSDYDERIGLENQVVFANVSNIERTQAFPLLFSVMERLNQSLGFIEKVN